MTGPASSVPPFAEPARCERHRGPGRRRPRVRRVVAAAERQRGDAGRERERRDAGQRTAYYAGGRPGRPWERRPPPRRAEPRGRDQLLLEARRRLHDAHAAFERLGARPWAERALAELRAAGGRRPRTVDRDTLTAQELRVATAVARGATNREVAAELFLSPKTVEFHLRLAYRKLGVRSRAQLARMAADGELEDAGLPSQARR